MHEPINVKSPNNTSKWQMGFNSAFKGLMEKWRQINSRIIKEVQYLGGAGYVSHRGSSIIIITTLHLK
jgi:hypothetical protein